MGRLLVKGWGLTLIWPRSDQTPQTSLCTRTSYLPVVSKAWPEEHPATRRQRETQWMQKKGEATAAPSGPSTKSEEWEPRPSCWQGHLGAKCSGPPTAKLSAETRSSAR